MECLVTAIKAFTAGFVLGPVALGLGLFAVISNNQDRAKRFIAWLSAKVTKTE